MSEYVSVDVARAFNGSWHSQTAAIDGVDLTFIYNGMIETKPKQIVEIGCCTGLSTALMALMLDEIGPGQIDSYDMVDRVYFDKSKEVGYLIKELAPNTQTKITVRTGKTSVDVAKDFAPNSVDFCFIDASHAHPWPTLDTLCVLPFLRPGAMIVHHDLQLYSSRSNPVGVGPKMLFDQILPRERITVDSVIGQKLDLRLKMRQVRRNIFAFKRDDDLQRQAARLAQGLYLPWSIPQGIGSDVGDRMIALWSGHYPREVADAFIEGAKRNRRLLRRDDPAASGTF